MLLLRSLLFDFLFYLIMLVQGILFLPAALWSAAGANWAMHAYLRTIFPLLRWICGLSIEIRGPVPEGNVVVCAKHQSFLDILILFHAMERPRFIMKKELKWAPVFGFYAMRIGSTPVDRGKKSKALTDMVERASKEAASVEGQTIIYPQGTRVAPGAHMPYKIGAGVLAQRMGARCIPVATNAGVFWGRKSLYRRPGVAVIEFLPEIPVGDDAAELVAELERVIEPASDALMAEAGFRG